MKILLFSLLIVNCNNSTQKLENELKTFDLKKLPELSTVKLSELGFVDIEYIPLETNDRSVISNISGIELNFGPYRIIPFDDCYLFYFWSTLLMFRDDGSFITRIGTKGRGPNLLPMTVMDDYTVISLVDALKLKTYVKSDGFKNSNPKYPEKKNELEKLANSLKETDNPVLILLKLKE